MLDDAYRPRCARPFKQGNRHKTLSLTPETVKSHVKHISVKLGVEKRAQAAFYPTIGAAIAAGLPWLSFCCSTCEQFVSVDLRTLDRHPGAASLISSIAASRALTLLLHLMRNIMLHRNIFGLITRSSRRGAVSRRSEIQHWHERARRAAGLDFY